MGSTSTFLYMTKVAVTLDSTFIANNFIGGAVLIIKF